jgi:hypothetical protein
MNFVDAAHGNMFGVLRAVSEGIAKFFILDEMQSVTLVKMLVKGEDRE